MAPVAAVSDTTSYKSQVRSHTLMPVFLFSGNGRSIAFSNEQGTLQSTLSTSVNGVTTFSADNIKHHVNASAGIVFRF